MKYGSKGRKVTRMPGDGLALSSFMRSTQMTLMCFESLTEQSFEGMLPCTNSNSFISEPTNTCYVPFHLRISTSLLPSLTRRTKSFITFTLDTFTTISKSPFHKILTTYFLFLLIFQAQFIIQQTVISKHPISGVATQPCLTYVTRSTWHWAPKWPKSKPTLCLPAILLSHASTSSSRS